MNNDFESTQVSDLTTALANTATTPLPTTEPNFLPAVFEPAAVESQIGVPIAGTSVPIKAFGFDTKQFRALADVWTIPKVMQRPGLIVIEAPPALVSITRNFAVSVIAGGTKMGGFGAVPMLRQAVVLLSKPGPAELSLILSQLSAAQGSSEIELHQVGGSSYSDLSLAERSTGALIEGSLKFKRAPNAVPHVVHILVRARQFNEIEQRDAVIGRLNRLTQVGMSVVVVWERRSQLEWAPPDDLGDTAFAVRDAYHATDDQAFALRLVRSNFVGAHELPPQVVSVKVSAGWACWSSVNYVSDDPDLVRMYELRAAGATMRQIAAKTKVDASTVSRRLKELDKELAAR